MASLTIRNIPERVLRKIRRLAATQHRSVNAQVLHWIERGVDEPDQEELDALVRKVRASREDLFRRRGIGSDSAVLIRRMRDERTRHWERAGR